MLYGQKQANCEPALGLLPQAILDFMNRYSSPTGKAIWIVLAFTLLIGILIFWKLKQAPAGGPPGGPQSGGKTPPQKVSAVVARNSAISLDLEFSGNLISWNEVQISPEAAGRIVFLNLKEGQIVKEGEKLLGLFDEDLRAQEQKLLLQESIALRNLDRSRELLKSKAGTQQETDNAENLINNIRADLNLLRANLKKTILNAPFSGTIGLCNVSKGSFVSTGQALAWLRETNRLKVEFSVPEQYAGLFENGHDIRFATGNPADTFSARVYASEPSIDPGTRTLTIRAEFRNDGNKLRPGSFAKVWPENRRISNALLLPSQAIIPDNRGKKVIVSHNGKAEFKVVQTGLRDKDKVQVISGISEGDTVLTTGLMFVKPDSEIIITKLD